MFGEVMRAHLSPHVVVTHNTHTELHIRTCAPGDVVVCVNGPAFRAAGCFELGHVALELREALVAAR